MHASITVITVTRGRPDMLVRAIYSVKQQDFKGAIKHLILIDGCDKTKKFLDDSFCRTEQLEWIVYHRRNGEMSGPSRLGYLRNSAIQITKSDNIAFLDDDNIFESNHISSLVNVYQKSSFDAVHSYRQLFHQDGRPFLEHRSPWRRRTEEGQIRYNELEKRGVFVRGSNIMRDCVDPKGTPNPIRTVDTNEWLIGREVLVCYPFSETYSYEDWKTTNTEDKKLLHQFVDNDISIGCSRLATLRYFLGGYSNTFENCDSDHRWYAPK